MKSRLSVLVVVAFLGFVPPASAQGPWEMHYKCAAGETGRACRFIMQRDEGTVDSFESRPACEAALAGRASHSAATGEANVCQESDYYARLRAAGSAKARINPDVLCGIAFDHGFSWIPIQVRIRWHADPEKAGVWSCYGAAHEGKANDGYEINWEFEVTGDVNGANTVTISTTNFPWNGEPATFLVPFLRSLLEAAGERDLWWMTRWVGTTGYTDTLRRETFLGKMIATRDRITEGPRMQAGMITVGYKIEFDLR